MAAAVMAEELGWTAARVSEEIAEVETTLSTTRQNLTATICPPLENHGTEEHVRGSWPAPRHAARIIRDTSVARIEPR